MEKSSILTEIMTGTIAGSSCQHSGTVLLYLVVHVNKATLDHGYPPMEAKLIAQIPDGDNWQYEPKWDGFRCIAFREGKNVDLRSKSGQPLGRYFPELIEALLSLNSSHFIIDGEIMIEEGGSFSFDSLLQRIHPAASRIAKLAAETPASYIVFDLLENARGKLCVDLPLRQRREQLEKFAELNFSRDVPVTVSPITYELKAAKKWLRESGAITDGVIAKDLDLPYQSGNRFGVVKVKRMRTIDCVVGGFRYQTGNTYVGSLLLGLYDEKGDLHRVGFTSSLSIKEKKALTPQLEKLKATKSFDQNIPGKPSRWSSEKNVEWIPLKPDLVIEVKYDHFTGGRFRHGTKLLRWRPEKAAGQCTLDQIT